MARFGLYRDRRSSVSVIIAAAAVPLVGLIGLAIEYGFWNQTKSQFEVAADTAALNAAKVAAIGLTAIAPPDPNWRSEAANAGTLWFNAALAQHTGFHFKDNKNLSVNVVRNGQSVTATVAYSATVPVQIGAFFGVSSFPLSGQSANTISIGGYTNITLLLDNSSSMLIGATDKDIKIMENYTPCSTESANEGQPLAGDWTGPVPTGCAIPAAPCGFACHNRPNSGTSASNYDYLWLARNPGARPAGTKHNKVTLRFDVVQDAVTNVIRTMEHTNVLKDQFQIGIYSFNFQPNAVWPLSADLAAGLTAVRAMQTPVVNDVADTNFPLALQNMATVMQEGGDGTSPGTPTQNLFIVTDGIQDYTSQSGGRVLGPINPADCDAIKAKNVSIYVLYTTYTPLPYNPFYVNNIASYLGHPSPNAVETALQACASGPANFFVATSPDEIDQALLAMLAATIRTPARFTI